MCACQGEKALYGPGGNVLKSILNFVFINKVVRVHESGQMSVVQMVL